MTDDDIRSLVGYERRLWKMTHAQLIAEARRLGLTVSVPLIKSVVIRNILDAQDIDPDILRDPPPRTTRPGDPGYGY